VRERVVMMDAGFEAVLGTVLLLGVVFGHIDNRDFPSPASDIVLTLFAFGLFAFAVALGTIVKNEAVSDTVLRALAAGNAAFAVLLAVWVLVGDGFSPTGRVVVWATVALLLMLATLQVQLLPRR
jgi:peptidoglycan/LPS O-acetylase OafA/YrhL